MRRIAIGAAWWLAAAYAFQFASVMYAFPSGLAALAAIPVAVLVATTRPRRVTRPADRRRIYQPRETPGALPEPSTSTIR
ncbi:MAG TPA: hypothetical protein VFP56_07870 [Candidatus Limnocylindrales bacterium]|nr:hypothetical protein [Candidatus Limnocylindrales bacterium]